MIGHKTLFRKNNLGQLILHSPWRKEPYVVTRGWESYSGWYWFEVEDEANKINEDRVFGFIQGFEEEWGYFSRAELNSLPNRVWEIPQENLSISGRRGMQPIIYKEKNGDEKNE